MTVTVSECARPPKGAHRNAPQQFPVTAPKAKQPERPPPRKGHATPRPGARAHGHDGGGGCALFTPTHESQSRPDTALGTGDPAEGSDPHGAAKALDMVCSFMGGGVNLGFTCAAR